MSEPADVLGECNAHLHIGDDYGDNHATMRCQLKAGHPGLHREQYGHPPQVVKIEWRLDERDADCQDERSEDA